MNGWSFFFYFTTRIKFSFKGCSDCCSSESFLEDSAESCSRTHTLRTDESIRFLSRVKQPSAKVRNNGSSGHLDFDFDLCLQL